ncbi:glycerol-3-phosphate transporter, partial [Francisella tularensis subsp. holarctica]|nr:glycerol-3-phosphate transporter [Francisella tularensis subsp. holarctica]
HNVGAGFLAIAVVPIGLLLFHDDWHGLFYVAGAMCMFVSILVLIFGADTPQSVVLPAIEVYKGYTNAADHHEQEFSAKEIF